MALIPYHRPRLTQPQDGVRFDAANPLAARFHTVYMPGISSANLGVGGVGSLAAHSAPDVVLPSATVAASIVVTNQQLTASRSYGPTPAYPITMIWVGQQGSNANTILANLAASGAISGSYWYVGGGSSTIVGMAARNAFGTALSLTATVPGGSALGTELVIVAQSLSASDHRLCVNGSAVATSTTNIGSMVAWDRVAIGQPSSANNQSTALLAVASGGVGLTDEQMQQLSRDPRAVYALFEPQCIWVPVSAGGATLNASLIDAASSVDLSSASATLAGTLTDATAAIELITSTATRAASLQEAASAVDLCAAAATMLASLADAAAGSDVQSAALQGNASLLDAATAADIASTMATMAATLTDGTTAVDLLAATRIANAAAVEAAAAIDLVNSGSTVNAQVQEAASTADVLNAAATLVVQLLEAGTVLDQLNAAPSLVALLTEAAAGTDLASAAVPQVYSVTALELAAALDVIHAWIEGAASFTAESRARLGGRSLLRLQPRLGSLQQFVSAKRIGPRKL